MDDSKRWDAIHQKVHKEQEWHSRYVEEKEALFPRNSLVVDLGAGTGADAIYLLKKGHRVVALDISEFALNILQGKAKQTGLVKNLVTRQMDFGLHTIPIKDDTADIVYSRISINYFGSKQTTKILMDIYRILNPGGRAYITLKSPEDKIEMEYLEKSATMYEPNVFIEGGMLRSRFTQEQLKEILQRAQIANYEVKAIKEDLSGRTAGHHAVLYLNEINFQRT